MRLKLALLISLLLHSLLLYAFFSFVPPYSPGNETLVRVSLKSVSFKKERKTHRVKRVKKKAKKRRRIIKKKPKRVVKRVKKKVVKKTEEPKTEETPKPEPEHVVEERPPESRQEKHEERTVARESEESVPEETVEEVPPFGMDEGEEEEETETNYLEENLQVIREVVQRYMSYPPIARRMGWEGTVVISFVLTPEGSIENERVEKSSGYELLDRNALRVVRLASGEFPRPQRDVRVVLPIVYRLEQD